MSMGGQYVHTSFRRTRCRNRAGWWIKCCHKFARLVRCNSVCMVGNPAHRHLLSLASTPLPSDQNATPAFDGLSINVAYHAFHRWCSWSVRNIKPSGPWQTGRLTTSGVAFPLGMVLLRDSNRTRREIASQTESQCGPPLVTPMTLEVGVPGGVPVP